MKSTLFTRLIFLLAILTCRTALADTTYHLTITPQGCATTLSVSGSNGCADASCDGSPGCVCAAKGDHIRWSLAGGEKFKFKFDNDDSPLKDSCGKNFKADDRQCKIKDEVTSGTTYNYSIILKSCAEGSDPKIIIR